jgi:hypothetical protein
MSIDPKYVELMHADIDGEISSADKAALAAFVANNAEARALHADLLAVHESLNSLPELDSPQHLKHTIMASIGEKNQAAPNANGTFLQSVFAAPAFRYAATFVAGSVLTLSLVSSDIIWQSTFDDVTGLVGTISEDVSASSGAQATPIEHRDVAGSVTLRSSGPILIVDFDLVSSKPVDIVASYTDRSVWFNGFAQLQSQGASVSAKAGRVTMKIEGKRRFALYLRSVADRDIKIHLQFISNGETFYEKDIGYVEPGHSS